MSDANGREEPGQLSGNLFFDGDYGSCDMVKKAATQPTQVEGQYCIAWWHLQNEVLFLSYD